jgi:hypothetical protein
MSSTNWSIRLCRINDWISSPLPRITISFPGCCLRLATARATSPLSSVEFCHGSGSVSVVDATYFCALLSTSVYGLSVRLGQTA